MYPLFETIQVLNGEYCNISFHQKRINAASQDLWGEENIVLKNVLPKVPENYAKEKVKCRIFYNKSDFKIEFATYQLPNIKTLKLINGGNIDYSKKYTDRSEINMLFGKKGSYDDILIIKNGLLCDTSYANIVLKLKETLITPKNPLLRGTKRNYYLSKKTICEQDISLNDLKESEGLYLINAMIDLEDNVFINPENITE
jgi:4-amino-4-deoxychorismate lyase